MKSTLCNIIILISSMQYVYCQSFTSLTEQIGINHTYFDVGLNGGGVAFIDYDNDGDEDFYLTTGFGRDKFYENNGDGTFADVSSTVGIRETESSYTMGVIAGDVDNDGFRDLFITTWDGSGSRFGVNILFKNNGDKTFTNVWNQDNPTDGSWSSSATFIDHNHDGLLDIYLLNFIFESGFITDAEGNFAGYDHDCFENRFYINRGNFEFEEATKSVGLDDTGCGLGVTATDYDNDNDMDIYIANDFGEFVEPNAMYNNDGGTFTKVSSSGAEVGMYGMGIAAGDIDNDLDVDLYITNIGRNVLLENDGGNFTNITSQGNVSNEWIIEDSLRTTGWGTVFADIDHDMDLDLIVNNGYQPVEEFILTGRADPNKMYINDGNGVFTDITDISGFGDINVAKGLAYSDYDLDGDLDLISVVMNDNLSGVTPATTLYQNNYSGDANWFQVKLEGTTVNRDAIGSKVFIYLGDDTIYREINGGSSHCSHSSLVAHFGIGNYTQVDSVKVVWTGGESEQTFRDFEANQRIKIKEGNLTNTATPQIAIDYKIYPQPANDRLHIVGPLEGDVLYQIIGGDGRTWVNKEANIGGNDILGNKTLNISLDGVPDGTYYFRAVTTSGLVIKPFVVIR